MNPNPPISPLDWPSRLLHIRALASPCNLCEIRCGVDRLGGARGRCGLSDTTHVYSKMLHFGEEQHLIPSYLVSFSGCSMHCTFCSEDDHLRPPFRAAPSSPSALADHLIHDIQRLRPRAKNINLVGGEPSISLPFISDLAHALSLRWPSHPPLLLNSNAYMTPEALSLCDGLISIYVLDLKFGPGACGWTIGKVDRYFEVVTARLLQAWDQVSHNWERLVVRHLLMPGHWACCSQPALQWLATHMPSAAINVMPSFTSFSGTRAIKHWAHASETSAQEHATALTWLQSLGLRHLLWDGLAVPDIVRVR